tara:strand:- start:15 stop:182 length:168 start_codon:yes stop_codon:yes gene_type:complete
MTVVMMSHIFGRLSGVTGMMMAQHVVSGWSMVGMKSGVSGTLVGAGNIMQLGRRI